MMKLTLQAKQLLIATTSPFIVCWISASSALATNVPDSELPLYTQYCPGENDRAVWYEPLGGRLEGYGNLVCLDESVQQTAQWVITPEGHTITWDALPESTQPLQGIFDERMLDLLNDPTVDINTDATATQWVDLYLTIVEPQLPTTGHTSGSQVGGPGDPIIYTLNGEIVTEAEILAFNAMIIEETRRNNEQRFKIKSVDRRRVLQQLIEINSWHDQIDVEEFIDSDTDWLALPLTRSEILFLRDTSESLVTRAIPGEDPALLVFTTDDGLVDDITNAGTENTEQPMSVTDPLLIDPSATELASDTTKPVASSSGGSISWLAGLMLLTLGYRALLCRCRNRYNKCL